MRHRHRTEDRMKTLLYYPLITIQTGRWLRQAILYWDQIGSIVPQNYDDEVLTPYTPDIAYLASEGEYRPFNPSALMGQEWGAVHEFEQELLNVLTTMRPYNTFPLPYSHRLDTKVHRDKVSSQVFGLLEQEGLAVGDEQNSNWYLFEHRIALIYMSLMAKYLAAGDYHSTVPSTDFRSYEKINFQARQDPDAFVCLKAKFRDILPVPRPDIPLSDILDFKRKRRDQLLAFRQRISEIETTVSRCTSEAEASEALVNGKEALEKDLADLEATLADAKLATVPGSWEAIFKMAIPPVAPLILAEAGKISHYTPLTNMPISWQLAGSAVFGSIGIRSYFVGKRNERRAMARNSPLSYLHAAKSDLGFGYTPKR